MATVVPVTMIDVTAFGPQSTEAHCTHCGADMTTTTKDVNGVLTWILFAICISFGLWYGCCLIPFYWKAVKNIEHYCASCGKFLGVYKRI